MMMFYDNKIEVVVELTTERLDVWVTYWGMHLRIEEKRKRLVGNSFYIATDKDGYVAVFDRAPTTDADSYIMTGNFRGEITQVGKTLPVCWKDSLVEYKL